MELEQILQRLDWLDDERRKDKTTIASLQERIITLEGAIPKLVEQVRELTSEMDRSSQMVARFDPIETSIAQMRVDLTRMIDSIEKQRTERDREVEKVRRADLESLNKAIGEVRKGLEPIPELKKSLTVRTEEDFRLGREIDELAKKFADSHRGDEDVRRTLKLLDDTIRQDSKRLVDVQGEVTALRKRVDEHRGRLDVTTDSLRKLELRMSEMQSAENERRQAQAGFFEKQALLQVDRDRLWKEWQARFEDVERQSLNLDTQLQSLDTTNRAIKRSQDGFEEITQRFERRINEITEMQRLVEERLRQEWVGFKADDQKRWTNYSLGQDELGRETNRQIDKLIERLVALEDLTQEVQDILHQTNEETHKRLQKILSASHDLLEEYERTFGNGH